MGNTNCSDSELFEKTIKEQEIFNGRVFRCVVKDVELCDGSKAKREVILHTGGACVLPVDEELNCYLVRQYRSGADEVLTEVPAGKVEPGEDPRGCAEREIAEETGFKAGKIEDLGVIIATPAYCSERIHMYLATDLVKTESSPDDGEFLRVIRIPLAEAVRMCDSVEIKDSKTVASIYKAYRRIIK